MGPWALRQCVEAGMHCVKALSSRQRASCTTPSHCPPVFRAGARGGAHAGRGGVLLRQLAQPPGLGAGPVRGCRRASQSTAFSLVVHWLPACLRPPPGIRLSEVPGAPLQHVVHCPHASTLPGGGPC